jgi:hypothetical protein
MAGAPTHMHSKHLSVVYTRVGPPPVVNETGWPGHGANFTCDYDGRDDVPVDIARGPGCPHGQRRAAAARPAVGGPPPPLPASSAAPASAETAPAGAAPPAPASRAAETASAGEEGEEGPALPQTHCYVLNAYSGYRLEWRVLDGILQVDASAPVADQNHYVALGFRPQGRTTGGGYESVGTGVATKFGMEGADIVVGHGGAGVVQTYYANLYTGPPDADASLAITNASAVFEPTSDGRGGSAGIVRLRFSRAVAGTGKLASLGYPSSVTSVLTPHADVIWSVGASSAGGSPSCSYHTNTRGLRFINWEAPAGAMSDIWRCVD